ncbi:uncharacterized protein LOC132196049 [Neocloeon triangulifer]|uniref:uncharacterized protein LOC132196049 n=1 Tax=Neocloeon triangulifer TaxID=2078957 RepID=UPI00286F8F4A|nr:uncharacterized protein LOC132196049 [Neocloeon triangulifer]
MRGIESFSLLFIVFTIREASSAVTYGRGRLSGVMITPIREKRALQNVEGVDPSLCEKECVNSGVCIGPNKCFCRDDQYGGDQCQLPINQCDIGNNAKNIDNMGCVIRRCTIECKTGFVLPNGKNSTTVHCERNTWVDTLTDDEWKTLPDCDKLKEEEKNPVIAVEEPVKKKLCG